ncbi:SGNH/GDSL hydrolase family protein [Patulibacter defluvii]|uniref:SGNH/GDSL hydrolase family protein n=1 Tax=Patulibacter defluvii TaxID=3095358 RepID=UPI002A76615C|nr:SGNH/GDSL hydrolase family protein [Patulibacter sp. DM4]
MSYPHSAPPVRRRLVALASLLLALALVAAIAAAPSRADSPDYVALGDSYSAASAILPLAPDAPLICGQSSRNYPKQVAQARGLSLKDVTCGAATTEHMLLPQYPGVPAQFDALKPDTKIVTLGIGGNDNGLFASAIVTCGGIDILWPGTLFDVGAPCRDSIGALHLANATVIEGKIAGIVRGIRARSPQAKILVVGYPDLLPQSGRCYPTLPLTSGDVAFLDQLTRRLNTSVQNAAEDNGATYVDRYTPSIGHDACKSSSVRWVDPLIPTINADGSVVPLHPNAAGMNAASGTVAAAFQAAGF